MYSYDPYGNIEDQAREQHERIQEQENNLNKIVYLTFTTEPGKKVLEYFKNNTLDKPSIPNGMSLFDAVAWGHRREGQNDIIREIVMRMKQAIEE